MKKEKTTCSVSRLKTPDWSFEPVKFNGKLVIEEYKQQAFAVGMCQHFWR